MQILPHKVGAEGVEGVGQKVCISTIYMRANHGQNARNRICCLNVQILAKLEKGRKTFPISILLA